ncbi:MAG: dihydrolipoamide acetyltransferase family protein [Myxococcota bacterium]|nr:dihydrolipoamide acetyltransferase family protein [Myxococcota bacterium]
MAFEFRLPDIGEGVVEGEIVSWKVSVGDTIAEDQPLVEVMTDKATVEIPSPTAGVVTALTGKEGDVIEVGQIFVVLDDGGDDSTVRLDPEEAPDAAELSPTASEPTPAAEPQAPAQEVTPTPSNGGPAPAAWSMPATRASGGKVLATPATRRLARELNLDLSQITGTGPQARVTKSDVIAYSEGRTPPTAGGALAAPGMGLPFTHQPVPPGSGPEERVPVRGLRRKISEAMVRSSLTIPHFSYVDEVDMTELVMMRKSFNEQLLASGGNKVSYLPFIMKAAWMAFQDFPEVNALYDNTTEEIVYKKYFNCGLATDTPKGLYVSVIHDIPGKSIAELGDEIVQVTTRVREGKASREDLSGSTFTITSIGNIGGLFATPIINYPEVAILGVNKIVERPVVRDGQIVVRHMTHLSPSFDHRVVDGAQGARFVTRLKALLENPGLILTRL